MAQSVIRHSVTAETLVLPRPVYDEICGRRSDKGTGFSLSTSVFLFSIIPPTMHITLQLYRVILLVLNPRKCEYLKDYSSDFEHAYMTTYFAS